MTTEMVERVAEALWRSDIEDSDTDLLWPSDCTDPEQYRHNARAAIRALMEPTEEMMKFVSKRRALRLISQRAYAEAIYEDFLTAALGEDRGRGGGRGEGQRPVRSGA